MHGGIKLNIAKSGQKVIRLFYLWPHFTCTLRFRSKYVYAWGAGDHYPLSLLTTLYHPIYPWAHGTDLHAAMICVILVAGHGVLLEREIQVYCTYSTDRSAWSRVHWLCWYSKLWGWILFCQEDTSGDHTHLIGIPKALLPARPGIPSNGDTILDYWWTALKRYWDTKNYLCCYHRSMLLCCLTPACFNSSRLCWKGSIDTMFNAHL